MRTSVDIPDDLFRRAKVEAARKGKTMKELIVDGLEKQLEESKTETGEPAWMAVFGMLADHKEDVRAAQALIDEEFSRIDLESWK